MSSQGGYLQNRPHIEVNTPGPLDVKPENEYSEYHALKEASKTYITEPKDSYGDSLQIMIFEAQVEYNDYKKLQKKMRTSSIKDKAVQWQRIKYMRYTQDKLRRRFISVNYFLKDCDDKRRSAQCLIEQEVAIAAKLIKDIENVRRSIKIMNGFREEFKETSAKYEHYERILNEVVDKSDIYVSIEDCMARCDALMLAQTEINKLMDLKSDEIAVMRQKMLQVTQNALSALLGMQTDLTKLQQSHEHAKYEVHKWEDLMERIKQAITNMNTEKDLTKDRIVTLYKMLCHRINMQPKRQRGDMTYLINFIYTEFLFMRETLKVMENGETDFTNTKIVRADLEHSKC